MSAVSHLTGSPDATLASVRSARPMSMWLDRPRQIASDRVARTFDGTTTADLVVIGGGLTGLWTAIEAAGRGQQVVVVDGGEIGGGASGRCGGFINASITHGIAHGHQRWPDEMPTIVALQEALWYDTLDLLYRHGANGVIEPCGKLTVATRANHVDSLRASVDVHLHYGQSAKFLDRDAVRAEVASPQYLAGVHLGTANGLCDPARLVATLADIALAAGVTLVEHVTIEQLDDDGAGVQARSSSGSITGRRVLLATNAYRPLQRRLRRRVIPVYDHVIATAPLDAQQWADIGWHRRCGVTDAGNQFHYYRPTPDGRILFGGWDATYHRGGRIDQRFEERSATHELLARHLVETFPAIAGVEVTHAWGGPIDTTSRFTPMFGSAMDGKLGWAIGFTGLGVGSSRFAALAALDVLDGNVTERSQLSMVRKGPMPFPPEPLRTPVIGLTKRALAREDRTGRRGVWLRLLDRFGVGFDT